ncbi:hypothetical protein [Nonomuraea basaltis]|uniref:hypothetical protein n=1 Tax=Nonomuraea basaltis TaxID=2495887 RepID=UPI00110C70CA|nr:hypothetical protein [Nonomuraea basaltis]TMR93998.1 hypothetical protein EJK15_36060 [Nonomuraea basaltis]
MIASQRVRAATVLANGARTGTVLAVIALGAAVFAVPAASDADVGQAAASRAVVGRLAHPLGNFSVNRYDALVVYQDRIEDAAIVDSAEIPTLQQRQNARPGEPASAYARRACAELSGAVRAEAGGQPLAWRVTETSFAYQPGAAGLQTSRLTCRLAASVRVDRPLALTFANHYRDDTVGWREITASGQGVRISQSDVPARSVSGGLRHYPADLLSSPLDIRQARFTAEPGTGKEETAVSVPGVDIVTRYTGMLADRLNGLLRTDRLTVPLGLLALLLSLVLGAVHAAMPGHGKTVMAAYLAGRDGRLRDACTVAATVTLTHTAGVLVLGVLVTVTASIAGDVVLGWLGLISGIIIALTGTALLLSLIHDRG